MCSFDSPSLSASHTHAAVEAASIPCKWKNRPSVSRSSDIVVSVSLRPDPPPSVGFAVFWSYMSRAEATWSRIMSYLNYYCYCGLESCPYKPSASWATIGRQREREREFITTTKQPYFTSSVVVASSLLFAALRGRSRRNRKLIFPLLCVCTYKTQFVHNSFCHCRDATVSHADGCRRRRRLHGRSTTANVGLRRRLRGIYAVWSRRVHAAATTAAARSLRDGDGRNGRGSALVGPTPSTVSVSDARRCSSAWTMGNKREQTKTGGQQARPWKA